MNEKEVMVNLMEDKNQGLDSIERRRTLAALLRIPPVLLGLGSLELIVEVATGHPAMLTANAKQTKMSEEDIQQYQKILKVYEVLFAEGLTYASINDIEKWITRIEYAIKVASDTNKKALLRILWEFQILCEKVYSSDLVNWSKAREATDNAIEIATALEDRDLQAASFYNSAYTHLREGRPILAKVDIDSALMYAKGALPQTKGGVYGLAAIYQAKDTSGVGITLAQKLLDDAERYAGVKSERQTVKFGSGKYQLDRANLFLNIGRPGKALECLDDAERSIYKSRLLVYINILRARCSMEQKKPEYEQAVHLLSSAMRESKMLKIQRHINLIDKLYIKLAASSYGNSPDVADLGFMLKDLQGTYH